MIMRRLFVHWKLNPREASRGEFTLCLINGTGTSVFCPWGTLTPSLLQYGRLWKHSPLLLLCFCNDPSQLFPSQTGCYLLLLGIWPTFCDCCRSQNTAWSEPTLKNSVPSYWPSLKGKTKLTWWKWATTNNRVTWIQLRLSEAQQYLAYLPSDFERDQLRSAKLLKSLINLWNILF